MTPVYPPLGPDPKSDQTFLLAILLTQSSRTGRASIRLSANSHHWTGKNPPPGHQSAYLKFWQRHDTSPIVDSVFRAAAWCAAGHSATRRRRPTCLDKNYRERVSIPPLSQVPCASRAAGSARFLADDSFRRRHILRSRSRLLTFETFPTERVPRHRDDTAQNSCWFFEPKFGRNKKEQLRGPARRNVPSVGRDLAGARR